MRLTLLAHPGVVGVTDRKFDSRWACVGSAGNTAGSKLRAHAHGPLAAAASTELTKAAGGNVLDEFGARKSEPDPIGHHDDLMFTPDGAVVDCLPRARVNTRQTSHSASCATSALSEERLVTEDFLRFIRFLRT